MNRPTSPPRYVAEIDRITEPRWNDVLEQFDDASIYQTWAYGAVSWGERQLSHLVLRRDDVVVAAAQVRIVRLPVIGSGIAYVRWGPVCVPHGSSWTPDVWRAATEALIQEYVVRRRLVLRIIPNVFVQEDAGQLVRSIWTALGLTEDRTVRPYQTMRVALHPEIDVLRRQLSSRWRRQLNIAERNNLEVVEGQTDDLYQVFVALYREMMARKRFDTTVDVEEFARIQQRLPVTQKMMTLICRSEGRPLAGLVVGTVGPTAIYLLAATGDEGLTARGSYLLQWHAMQRLKDMGRAWYDLGGINEETNPGVFTFKSGMGGEQVHQVSRFDISGHPLSTLSVALGEGVKRLASNVVAMRHAAPKRADHDAV